MAWGKNTREALTALKGKEAGTKEFSAGIEKAAEYAGKSFFFSKALASKIYRFMDKKYLDPITGQGGDASTKAILASELTLNRTAVFLSTHAPYIHCNIEKSEISPQNLPGFVMGLAKSN
ncbi:MAG: hypothetical protein ACTSXQ_02680 [Alphaproteobacteria bacterium]